jgi:hypothetical protein
MVNIFRALYQSLVNHITKFINFQKAGKFQKAGQKAEKISKRGVFPAKWDTMASLG